MAATTTTTTKPVKTEAPAYTFDPSTLPVPNARAPNYNIGDDDGDGKEADGDRRARSVVELATQGSTLAQVYGVVKEMSQRASSDRRIAALAHDIGLLHVRQDTQALETSARPLITSDLWNNKLTQEARNAFCGSDYYTTGANEIMRRMIYLMNVYNVAFMRAPRKREPNFCWIAARATFVSTLYLLFDEFDMDGAYLGSEEGGDALDPDVDLRMCAMDDTWIDVLHKDGLEGVQVARAEKAHPKHPDRLVYVVRIFWNTVQPEWRTPEPNPAIRLAPNMEVSAAAILDGTLKPDSPELVDIGESIGLGAAAASSGAALDALEAQLVQEKAVRAALHEARDTAKQRLAAMAPPGPDGPSPEARALEQTIAETITKIREARLGVQRLQARRRKLLKKMPGGAVAASPAKAQKRPRESPAPTTTPAAAPTAKRPKHHDENLEAGALSDMMCDVMRGTRHTTDADFKALLARGLAAPLADDCVLRALNLCLDRFQAELKPFQRSLEGAMTLLRLADKTWKAEGPGDHFEAGTAISFLSGRPLGTKKPVGRLYASYSGGEDVLYYAMGHGKAVNILLRLVTFDAVRREPGMTGPLLHGSILMGLSILGKFLRIPAPTPGASRKKH